MRRDTLLSETTIAPPLFILAPPRSFTTVVCAMLGQHPQMYGLPELHLLGVRTMTEWFEQCAQASFDLDNGLVRVVAELFFGEQSDSNVRRARGWLRRRTHCTTGMVFEHLAKRVYPLILVEKSPSLVYSLNSLRHVHTVFPDTRYIHLLRHPRGHGESVMRYLEERAKLGPIPSEHWLLGLASYPYSFSYNPIYQYSSV